MNLGDPVPLQGVPEGCVARPILISKSDNEHSLPRDRSGRVKLSIIELTADKTLSTDAIPTGSDRRFLLGRETRRWPTIVSHYGNDDAAWSASVALCRAGFVTLRCDVIAARLGPATQWRWTQKAHDFATAERTRRSEAGNTARRLLHTVEGMPAWVNPWLEGVERSGLLTRSVTEDENLIVTAAACLAALPMPEGQPMTRTELAARYGGARGAHAFDDGHRLTALVLRGAAAMTESVYPRNAAERRTLWASVGILCDSASTTVLVANLRPEPNSLVARHLRERAEAALPSHICGRDLQAPIRLPRGSLVYVCENPAVLEAAVDRGADSTIVCTAGNPTTVVMELLRQLSESGATIRYRGDFDWPGVAIANRLVAGLKCETWLFDCETYQQAASTVAGDAVPLVGSPIAAQWDRNLCPAMETEGIAIHEELLTEHLIDYLMRTP